MMLVPAIYYLQTIDLAEKMSPRGQRRQTIYAQTMEADWNRMYKVACKGPVDWYPRICGVTF